MNFNRLKLMILQMAVIGIIAIGVTQIIITGGIDLSSGSVVAFVAVVAASFGQAANATRPYFENLDGTLPVIVPLIVGIGLGGLCGFTNGFFNCQNAYTSFYCNTWYDGFCPWFCTALYTGETCKYA